MNEPVRRSMSNGPTQKPIKKYSLKADSMSTHPGDEESVSQALKSYKQTKLNFDEDNQESNQT